MLARGGFEASPALSIVALSKSLTPQKGFLPSLGDGESGFPPFGKLRASFRGNGAAFGFNAPAILPPLDR
jgi:hypothetical protein